MEPNETETFLPPTNRVPSPKLDIKVGSYIYLGITIQQNNDCILILMIYKLKIFQLVSFCVCNSG